MSQFTLVAKTTIFTQNGTHGPGTVCKITLPDKATESTVFTNPQFRNSILAQFRCAGIDLAPNQIGSGYWRITDVSR